LSYTAATRFLTFSHIFPKKIELRPSCNTTIVASLLFAELRLPQLEKNKQNKKSPEVWSSIRSLVVTLRRAAARPRAPRA